MPFPKPISRFSMRALDLINKKVVIWGTGREGVAAFHFVRGFLPSQQLTFIDEGTPSPQVHSLNVTLAHTTPDIESVLATADVVIKSPGVSLYHPLLLPLKARHVPITSLLNLWASEPRRARTIYVTGTKGKSTTASLLAHVLNGLHKKTALLGNIGRPVTEAMDEDLDFIVIETSSYQAATFDGKADIAVLTSLYPEHLDWHKTLDAYYRDKLNLLHHAAVQIMNAETLPTLHHIGQSFETALLASIPSGIHIRDHALYAADTFIGHITNSHLSRQHNLSNVCLVLTVLQKLGFSLKEALPLVETFKGLPHRQQELGTKNGILYVNDSISTTPQSAIAAMQAYQGRPLTIIVGGYDRGIDYTPLVEYLSDNAIPVVLCMGPSGARIRDALSKKTHSQVYFCENLTEIMKLALQHTPTNGVILLSPAAPSYGIFKNFEERGFAFTKESGF